MVTEMGYSTGNAVSSNVTSVGSQRGDSVTEGMFHKLCKCLTNVLYT